MPIITTSHNEKPRPASSFSTTSSALTDEDLEARRGCFTGSENYKLMTKASRGGNWSAYTPEMICDFGKVAKDYIFQKLMERKTGIVTRMKQTQEMRYGNEHEDDIFEPLAADLLKNEGIVLEKCKFLKIDGQPSAGSTPDGRGFVLGDLEKKNKIAAEIKCCLTAGTFRHRLETANTEQNCDYWQCITEMLTLGVDRLVYAVGYPPKSFSDPVPDFEILEVRMSKIHAKALLDRINLADKVINDFIANDREYKDFEQSMLQSVSEWKPQEENKPAIAIITKEKKQTISKEIIIKNPLGDCPW